MVMTKKAGKDQRKAVEIKQNKNKMSHKQENLHSSPVMILLCLRLHLLLFLFLILFLLQATEKFMAFKNKVK